MSSDDDDDDDYGRGRRQRDTNIRTKIFQFLRSYKKHIA